MQVRFSLCVPVLAAFLAFACGGDAAAPGITSLSIQPGTVRLTAIDQTAQLTATSNGGAVDNADLTWSTANGSVASVSASGLVRAMGAGSATITARTAGGVSASVPVTVEQEPASLTVSPSQQTVEAGQTVKLTADVKDANGHTVGGAVVAWTSSDTSVATVDGTGEVRGRLRGSVVIRASIASLSGTADVTVILADFRPGSNATLSGTVAFGTFSIPAGVTVNVTGDLIVQIEDSLAIDGRLAGDCTRIDLRVSGPVRVAGEIDNRCVDPGADGAPLHISAGAAITLDSARIDASGSLLISNRALPAPFRPGALRTASAVNAPCGISGLLSSWGSVHGADGSPDGANGEDGDPVVLECGGPLTLNAFILGGSGGDGGKGTGTALSPGRGGNGGTPGEIRLQSDVEVIVLGRSSVASGRPGNGGMGTTTNGFPAAFGGHGGSVRPPRIQAPVIRIDGEQLFIQASVDGAGGDAILVIPDGADATDAAPAQPGPSAEARGGNATSAPQSWKLLQDILAGAVTDLSRVDFEVAPNAAAGGRAIVSGGRGGNGSRGMKHGAASSSMIVAGGAGIDAFFLDDRTGEWLGPLGDGGSIAITQSYGGRGFTDCVVGALEPAGNGGPGGDVTAAGGIAGRAPDGRLAKAGSIFIRLVGLGGDGGKGTTAGTGGPAGTLTSIIGELDMEGSFQPGMPGGPCNYTTSNTIAVATGGDPSNHESVLMVTTIVQGSMKLLPGDVIEIGIGGVTLTGALAFDGTTWSFSATGGGTISGRTATGTFTGTLSLDAGGRAASITGSFTFGSGGELPGGQPVTYNVGLNLNSP